MASLAKESLSVNVEQLLEKTKIDSGEPGFRTKFWGSREDFAPIFPCLTSLERSPIWESSGSRPRPFDSGQPGRKSLGKPWSRKPAPKA